VSAIAYSFAYWYSSMLLQDGHGEESGRAGEPALAERVVREYSDRLLRLAKSRLGSKLQAKICPEDIVQSALMSFFRTQPSNSEEACQADVPADLWGLLVIITLRKCLKWHDVFNTDKRSVLRERSLNSGTNDTGFALGLLSREPGPEDVAMVCELSESLLECFDERHQEMLRLEIAEIATALKSSKRTVSRVIAAAKLKLQDLIDNG
jgi:DNA-directed RNA polymerase specialized sigma24 family protein